MGVLSLLPYFVAYRSSQGLDANYLIGISTRLESTIDNGNTEKVLGWAIGTENHVFRCAPLRAGAGTIPSFSIRTPQIL